MRPQKVIRAIITYLLFTLGITLVGISWFIVSTDMPFQNKWLDVIVFLFGVVLLCTAGIRISEDSDQE